MSLRNFILVVRVVAVQLRLAAGNKGGSSLSRRETLKAARCVRLQHLFKVLLHLFLSLTVAWVDEVLSYFTAVE